MIYIHSLICILVFGLLGENLNHSEKLLIKFIGLINWLIVYAIVIFTMGYAFTSCTNFYLEWFKSL